MSRDGFGHRRRDETDRGTGRVGSPFLNLFFHNINKEKSTLLNGPSTDSFTFYNWVVPSSAQDTEKSAYWDLHK